MIIKKPYAFLIKHFRVIHLILSILVIFLTLKGHAIFTFFNDYANNGYYAYANNLANKYINFYMFIAVIFVILISSFIYLLMQWKKKSRAFYISMCAFYFFLFIGLLVYFNIFGNLINTTLDIRTVRAYRDISAIMYFPQYFFVIYSVIRAIGFDVKKFDFKSDLEDLDIAEEDQEEIELTFGDNSYKYKRGLRKLFRELKYYIIENKFFFVAICGVVTLVLVFFVYMNKSVYNKKYRESEYFNVNGVIFRVVNSYVSDVGLNGKGILDKKKYVAVKVSMENTNMNKVKLSTDGLRLMINDKYYYPVYTKSDYFTDLGEGYYKNTLYSGEKYEYLIIYEIPKEIDFEKTIFRMVDSVNILNGDISAKYKDVTLNLENLEKAQGETEIYIVGEAISLEDSTLLNSEFIVNSYELGETFVERYNYCVGTECYDGKKIIKAEALGKDVRTILKLNVEVDLDESLYINKFLTNNSDFVSTFGSISYILDGIEKSSSFTVKYTDNINTNNVYLEVPAEINRATTIKLRLNIRNREYIINLY